MTMSYFGTSAASTAKNPPVLLYSAIGGQVPFPGVLTTKAMGAKVWFYTSTNAPGDVDDAGAFIDGGILGMMPGDVLIGVVNGGAATTDCFPYIGILNSTQSSLSTAAYNITSNFTT